MSTLQMTEQATKYASPPFECGIRDSERFWIAHYSWFLNRGYQLPARCHPDWTPSWLTSKTSAFRSPDHNAYSRAVCDATRTFDNKRVFLKRVTRWEEIQVGLRFSSPPLASDPRNHCVPIYEVLQVPDVSELYIIVMPMLHEFETPPFDTVAEFVECFRQIIEGVQFMHLHFVAHGDCTLKNIMMDTSMFPHGFHPFLSLWPPDLKNRANFLTRTECWPRYYLTDFGLSNSFDPFGCSPKAPVVKGRDRSAPEHRTRKPCNPFPTDVYYVGNMIKTDFLDNREEIGPLNLEFLRPLVMDMTQEDPSKRPTINEVASRYDALWRSLSVGHLRSLPQMGLWDIAPCGCSVACWPCFHIGRRWKRTILWTPPMPRNIPAYDEKQWQNPDVTVDRTWYTGEMSHQVGQPDNSRFDVDPAVEASDENGQPPSRMVEAVSLSRQASVTRSEPTPSLSSSSSGRWPPAQVQGHRSASLH